MIVRCDGEHCCASGRNIRRGKQLRQFAAKSKSLVILWPAVGNHKFTQIRLDGVCGTSY
jgi:hypothetical protein